MKDVVVQRHCLVRGRVQGVGFRAFVVRIAGELGLNGWVRNREDGSSVELLVEGPAGAVQQFIDRLWLGPAQARVDSVDCEHRTPSGLSGGFVVRP